MLTAQPRSSSSIKHHHVPAAIIRRPEMVTGVGRFGGFSMQNKNAVCFRSKKRQQQVNIIRAMSGCDDILLAAKKGIGNGSSLVAPTVEVKAVISIKKRKEESINVILEEQWATLINGIGRGISMQLISEDIDPVTNSGKSVESSVKGLPKPSNSPNVVEYTLNFAVPTDFGCPGAIIVTNFLDKEFYLVNVVLHGHGGEPLVFPANTWIHSQKDNPESRIIFSNKACLPSQTPSGIKDLRREDLLSLRGSGKGERKMHERIYDYAVYNDLGDPDKSDDLARPTLGGSDERPYPRRCRTGRPPTKKDSSCESRAEGPHPFYVPRDEFPNEIKITTFSAEDLLKGDRFDWLRDDQFARQTLAGANAVNIELLKDFPIMSKLDPAVYGPQESSITKEVIEHELHGMTVEEAIAEKRLFIVDYHDLLLPFVEKINSLPAGRKTYASRTVFFYMPAGVLRPIVIELSLPPTSTAPRKKHIFIQGHDSTTHWIWKLAKAHVSSNDFGVHQMVNHWLKTHACMEPYIIATHRQLSSVHPVHKLLRPHLSHTLQINAMARRGLANAGGMLETCSSFGDYAMEVTSAAYKSTWRFDMEALPADLVQRGMAVEDPSMPCGVKLVIEDYPYAADGLLVWDAIKDFVESYVKYYYNDTNSITSDIELQAWWNEIKNKGHHDKGSEPWWPKLENQKDLSGILTTMIWISTGQHTAMHFGHFPFGGQVPNRPVFMQKLIPEESDPEYQNFLLNPEDYFLSSLSTESDIVKAMPAVQNVMAILSHDEEYIHQLKIFHSAASFNDPGVLKLLERFSAELDDIEKIISQRNKDTTFKNRNGAGIPP